MIWKTHTALRTGIWMLAAGVSLLAAIGAPAMAVEQARAAVDRVSTRRVNVDVLVLALRDFTLTGTYVGDLQPNERAVLKSEVEGLIEQVTFDESDWVKKDQVLVNIATEQAQVRRDQARVSLELAEATYARNKSMFEKQLIPPQALDDSRTALDMGRLNLQAAEIELRKSMVRAPFDGVVKTRSATRGEFALKGGLIAEILDLSQLTAKISVPEREIVYFTPGKPVEAWLDALPDRTFPGKVKTIGPESDAKSRNFPLEVAVDNANRQLRPGMLVRVKAELIEARGQIVIPRSAVLERQDGRVVFVERRGIAHARTVKLGATVNDHVQVTGGLAPEERLIVAGQTRIADQEPVLVVRSLKQSAEERR